MTTHEQVAQDLPLYALGTLTDDDRRCVEEHLHECARCRFELHLLREDMNRLSLQGPEIELEEPRATRDSAPMITLDQPPPASNRVYWLASIPVILCIVLGAMVVQLRTQVMELTTQNASSQSELSTERAHNEHARLIDSIVHDSASQHLVSEPGSVQIQLLYNASLHRSLAIASHLPRPNSPLVYQLWLIPNGEGRPVAAGAFIPDAEGNAFILSGQLPRDLQVASFQITTEAPGAQSPTTLPTYSGK